MEALLNLHERCVVLKDLPDCDCAQILRYFEDLRGYCEACVDKTISGETIWVILFSSPEEARTIIESGPLEVGLLYGWSKETVFVKPESCTEEQIPENLRSRSLGRSSEGAVEMSGTVASSQEQVVASPDSLNCTMDTRTNDLGASRTPRRYIKDGKTPDQSHYMAMDHCNANVDKKRIGAEVAAVRPTGGTSTSPPPLPPRDHVISNAISHCESTLDSRPDYPDSASDVYDTLPTLNTEMTAVSKTDAYRALFRELSENTTDDKLKEFLERKCKVDPKCVERGEQVDAAVVLFKSQIDIGSLSAQCEYIACDERFMKVSPVEEVHAVKVTGFGPNITEDNLKTFFGRKTKGAVTGVSINSNRLAAIVTFKESRDVLEASTNKTRPVLLGYDLVVKIHHRCLEDDTVSAIPTPKLIDNIEPSVVRFLAASQRHKASLESLVQPKYGQIKWLGGPEDIKWLQISCSLHLEEDNVKIKLQEWFQGCRDAAMWINDTFKCHKIAVADKVWSQVDEYLAYLHLDDRLAVEKRDDVCTVLLVGETFPVRESADTLTHHVGSAESRLDSDASISKWFLSRECDVDIIYETLRPQEDVLVERNGCSLHLMGNRKLVDEEMDFLQKQSGAFARKEIMGLSMEEKTLLGQSEARKYIMKTLRKYENIIFWEVVGEIHVFASAFSIRMLENSVQMIRGLVHKFNIESLPLERENLENGIVRRLKTKYADLINIVVDDSGIHVATVDYLKCDVGVELKEYLDSETQINSFLDIDSGRFGYALVFRSNDFTEIETDILPTKTEIVHEKSRKGFRLEGSKHSCRKAIAKLREVCDNLVEKEFCPRWPGFASHLRNEKLRNKLAQIELDKRCILKVFTEAELEDNSQFTFVAKTKIGTCSLSFLLGDILQDRRSEVLVLPVCKSEEYDSGLRQEVVKKGGFQIQKECDGQSLVEGDTFKTTAGDLEFRSIIHATLPKWDAPGERQSRLLASAVYNSLEQANQGKFKSVIFPPLGVVVCKFPLNVAARAMVSAMRRFLQNNTATTIQNIVICDKFLESAKFFQRELQMSGENDYISIKEVNNQTPNAIFRREVTETINVDIQYGLITDQQVDVIVNTTTSDLNLKLGDVSRAVLAAAGEDLEYECVNRYKQGIQKGEIAVTASGNLPCKAVFHIDVAGQVGSHEDNEYKEDVNLALSMLVRKCLDLAHCKGHTSIAFPAVGTGKTRLPPDIVAKTMLQAADAFSYTHPHSKLRKMVVVIKPGDTEIMEAYETSKRTLTRDNGQREFRLSRHTLVAVDDFEIEDKRFKTTIGDVTLCIKEGDITKESTNVIVNSTQKDLDLSKGQVSAAILKAAGPSVQAACRNTEKGERMKKDRLVVTDSGGLLCRYIVHLKARSKPQGWKESIAKCLEEVEKLDCISVSFPAVGLGQKGCDTSDIARAMVEVFTEYISGSKYKGRLKLIQIVIYVPKIMKTFLKVIQKKNGDKENRPASGCRDLSAKIHIYGQDRKSVEEAASKLNELYIQDEVNFPDLKTVQRLDASDFSHIKDLAKTHCATVTKERSVFKIHGYDQGDICEAKQKIESYLRGKKLLCV